MTPFLRGLSMVASGIGGVSLLSVVRMEPSIPLAAAAILVLSSNALLWLSLLLEEQQ